MIAVDQPVCLCVSVHLTTLQSHIWPGAIMPNLPAVMVCSNDLYTLIMMEDLPELVIEPRCLNLSLQWNKS